MSKVSYNGARIIPSPRVSLTKSYQTTGDGQKIGSLWQITITGKVLAYMGSPTAGNGLGADVGDLWEFSGYPSGETFSDSQRLGAIIRKQQQIRGLFSEDGHMFEVQGDDGLTTLRANIRINSISFPEQGPVQWFNDFDFTVDAEADIIYMNGTLLGEDDFTSYISSANETWQLETVEEAEGINLPRTYRLSHTVSATGKRFYDDTGTLIKQAFEQARDWVIPKLGLDSYYLSSSGVKDLPDYYQGFNHVRSENIDELGGEYSVTETWLLASGTATEDFTITTTTSLQDGLTNVSINGTINGLELRNSNMELTSSKYDNASTKFNSVSGVLLSRAQTYSGKTLNIEPLSSSIGKNPITGVITYTYDYNDRPSNFISSARSESIEIIDDFGGSIIAAISVPYRSYGPVLQDMGTKKESTRTLNLEIVLGPQSGLSVPTSINSDVNSLISSAAPADVYQSFLVDNTQSWNPKEGRLSITKSWLYEA